MIAAREPVHTTLKEKLQQLESQLAMLSQVKTEDYKESKKLKRESEALSGSIANIKSYLSLKVGQQVTDGQQIGTVAALTLSPGGMPEAWVKWYNQVPIPEQPSRLKLEPFLQNLKISDEITINSQHTEAAGQTLAIKEFQGNGWVKTTTNQLFHCDFFSVVNQPSTTTGAPIETESIPIYLFTDELTSEDERDRLFLERKVERAFYEAGKALKELRERRLYRSTHNTFEEYCKDRFGFKRRYPYQLIDAANVFEHLIACAPTEETAYGGQATEMCANGAQILPTTERQVRPLTQLEPSQQRKAWQQAVEAAGGTVPSGRIVSDIVQRIKERTKVPNPYRVGDVCAIIVKDNPDLRSLRGCWCIVMEVRDFSCLVRAWNGEYIVRGENLKDLGYSPAAQEEMKQLSVRLSRLYDSQMEETARGILANLGKIDRPFLTEFEEKLLQFLEEESI